MPQIILSAEISRRKRHYQSEYQRKLLDLTASGTLFPASTVPEFSDLVKLEASVSASGVLPQNFPSILKPVAILFPSIFSVAEKLFKQDPGTPIVLQNFLRGIWRALGFGS